jgi:hypothetical protein
MRMIHFRPMRNISPTMLSPTGNFMFIAVNCLIMCFALTEFSLGWSAAWPTAIPSAPAVLSR